MKKRTDENSGFLFEYSSRSAAISIGILTEEIELVLAENQKVWISFFINIIRVFGLFGLPRICCMDRNKKFVDWIIPEKTFCMETFVGKIMSVVTEK